MIALQKLFVILLASVLSSTRFTVTGFSEPYLRSISDDLTEENQNSSISVTNGADIFLANSTSSRGGEKLNHLCDSKPCLSLCCPLGKSLLDGGCVQDDDNPGNLPEIPTLGENDDDGGYPPKRDLHLITDDPCVFGWMSTSVLNGYDLLHDGSIYAPDSYQGPIFDFEHYCLFRKPKSTLYLAKVCKPWIQRVYWHIACLIFATFVLLAIFIGYSIVPELRNLHGLVFRSYIATYIFTNLSFLGQHFTNESKTHAHLFTFFVFSLHYAAGCCALWLNVMSFNIWRTFRGLRTIENNTREHDRRKYIWYAIYAWGTPAVVNCTIAAVMYSVPYFHRFSINKNLILWCCAGVLTTVVVVNTFLYTATAFKIRKYQKDTANLTSGVNKHHDSEKQWFNLHVKLFLITGIHTTMWVIWELWPIPVNTHLMIVIEVVQSILVFIIFIWKENVKRSLRKTFDEMLCRLNDTFGLTSHETQTTKI